MLKGLKVCVDDKEIWALYILKCADGTFYTGITNDLDRRFQQHKDGKAAKYTRARRPVKLLYSEICGNRSAALIRECAVKALKREQKQKLIRGIK